MNIVPRQRRFLIMLAFAVLLHALLLLVPAARDTTGKPVAVEPIRLQLRQAPAVIDDTVRETAAPSPDQGPPRRTVRPVDLADLPGPPIEVPAAVSTPGPAKTEVSPAQVLSAQFDYPHREPMFGGSLEAGGEDWLRKYARNRPSLDEVLKQPSLQLPFEDDRIYLVDSYDPGFAGSVERFFDEVTVSFGWTTRYGTRIQCGWVLVVGGCGWGPNMLFHKKAKKRKGS